VEISSGVGVGVGVSSGVGVGVTSSAVACAGNCPKSAIVTRRNVSMFRM